MTKTKTPVLPRDVRTYTPEMQAFCLKEMAERHAEGRYLLDEVAAMLAAQTIPAPEFPPGIDPALKEMALVAHAARLETEEAAIEADMRAAWRDGALSFWLASGRPKTCRPAGPDDAFGDEAYLGLEGEHTTADAVNRWLEQSGAEYRFEVEAAPPARQKGRGEQQRALILQTIRELGHNPLALPPKRKGRPWVRADVVGRLCKHELFRSPNTHTFSKYIFKGAWDYLLAEGGEDGPPKGIRERK